MVSLSSSNSIYFLILTKQEGIYNICSGQQYKVLDIVKQLYQKTASTSSIKFDNTLNRSTVPSYTCGKKDKIEK